MAEVKKPEFDWLSKLTYSVIIAVINSDLNRTSIHHLAELLKYTDIDEKETPLPPQSSDPGPSNREIDPSDRIQIVLQKASTELDSKTVDIINLSSSDLANLDWLVELARTKGALLIIIECKSLQADNHASHEVGDVIIPVDMQNLSAEKLISDLKPITENYQKVIEGRHKHPHVLNLKDHLPEWVYKLKCKYCRKLVSDPVYQCARCDLFIFHKYCAELPKIESLKENPPQHLRANPPKYDEFPQKHPCTSCRVQKKAFSLDCHDCLLETNLKNKRLPIVFKDEKYHEHPLSLIMMPLSVNFEYKCSGCGEFGSCISYKCYVCKFDLHLNCVLLPNEFKHKSHVHPLTLTFDPTKDRQGEYYCDVCQKQREENCWTYYCKECKFVAHVNCITPTVGSDS